MKIILGNAPIKNGNRGCVALTITIACMIDEIMKKAGLSYELYLSDSQYDDRKTHEILIDDRKIEFKDCRYPIGISLKNTIGTIIKNIVKGSDLNIFSKPIIFWILVKAIHLVIFMDLRDSTALTEYIELPIFAYTLLYITSNDRTI